MADVPPELWYTKDHEWVRFDDNGLVMVVGVTDFAQRELGDIVFVEMPRAGSAVTSGVACGTIEAVKAVAELMSPVTGAVLRVNEAIDSDPALVNREPYGGGWLFEVASTTRGAAEGLLSAAEYRARTGEE